MQVLDQASRGPRSASEAIWSMTPGLATAGALLMIFSVAINSFAQQILAFPLRNVLAPIETHLSRPRGNTLLWKSPRRITADVIANADSRLGRALSEV